DTPFVQVCLNMALWRRDHAGHAVRPGLIHHSDAGSQGGFNWSSQHRPVRSIVRALPTPRRGFSSQGFCVVGC
ncbi:hypothetical protein E3O45_10505, partial [Cryobacterium sp. TMS1-20-1]